MCKLREKKRFWLSISQSRLGTLGALLRLSHKINWPGVLFRLLLRHCRRHVSS
jgi:hypothetical protein